VPRAFRSRQAVLSNPGPLAFAPEAARPRPDGTPSMRRVDDAPDSPRSCAPPDRPCLALVPRSPRAWRPSRPFASAPAGAGAAGATPARAPRRTKSARPRGPRAPPSRAGAAPPRAALLTHGPRDARRVALTFDADMTRTQLTQIRDGSASSTWYDERIVDLLERTRTPATIFLSGLWVKAHRAPARALAPVRAREPLAQPRRVQGAVLRPRARRVGGQEARGGRRVERADRAVYRRATALLPLPGRLPLEGRSAPRGTRR
jgi:Polysaccharide deacetylase